MQRISPTTNMARNGSARSLDLHGSLGYGAAPDFLRIVTVAAVALAGAVIVALILLI